MPANRLPTTGGSPCGTEGFDGACPSISSFRWRSRRSVVGKYGARGTLLNFLKVETVDGFTARTLDFKAAAAFSQQFKTVGTT